jgi:hypothetical protein
MNNNNASRYQQITDALFSAHQVNSFDTINTLLRGLSQEESVEVARLTQVKRDEANDNEEIRKTAEFLLGLLNTNN